MSKKISISSADFYKYNERAYNAISDYIRDEHNMVPLEGVSDTVQVDFMDCYLDGSDGALFVPSSYKWTYRGSNNTDDPDEYEPQYDSEPTLTKQQVDKLITDHPLYD